MTNQDRAQQYWEQMGGVGSHPWLEGTNIWEAVVRDEAKSNWVKEGNSMSAIDTATPEDWDKASNRQVGGSHYKDFAIQPIEFVVRNDLGFCEANAVKYICRHAAKGGQVDIDKAIHYLELLKEYKYGQ